MPGFHAFTGCDYNPAFFKRGKQRPFNILKKNVEYQQAFLQFGEEELFTDYDTKQKVFDVIQKFICDVYNVPGIIDVDAARLQLFINTYTVSDVSEEFNRKSVRNFDSCNLPPCKSELFQQFCRANYIASIWNNAHAQNLPDFGPENNGWTLDENQYQFYWFDGDQLPSFVSELLENESGMLSSHQINFLYAQQFIPSIMFFVFSEDSNKDDDDDDLNIEIQNWFEDESRNSYEANYED